MKITEQGFTIIEIVIVIALFTVLSLGLLGMYDWHTKVYYLEQAETQATANVRTSMNNMTKYIAQAIAITSVRTISGTTYTTGTTTVIAQLPSIDSSGNIISGNYDYVVYYLTNGSLYQLIEKGTGSARLAGTKLMGKNIHALTFTYNSADVTTATTVTADLESRVTTRGTQYVPARVTNTIFLRNR